MYTYILLSFNGKSQMLVKLRFLIQCGSFLGPELQAQYNYLKQTLN